jgi:hypothetical protein
LSARLSRLAGTIAAAAATCAQPTPRLERPAAADAGRPGAPEDAEAPPDAGASPWAFTASVDAPGLPPPPPRRASLETTALLLRPRYLWKDATAELATTQ